MGAGGCNLILELQTDQHQAQELKIISQMPGRLVTDKALPQIASTLATG